MLGFLERLGILLSFLSLSSSLSIALDRSKIYDLLARGKFSMADPVKLEFLDEVIVDENVKARR
jgi:hypothetical protein